MTIFLSVLCALFSLLLSLDFFLDLCAIYSYFPIFTATAAALAGAVIGFLEYRAHKSKKKRRPALFAVSLNAFAGIAATSIWIYFLLRT
ncbi:hypothetical protein LJC27_07015 [Christensenellaceae bacterium OttesenSCG-928-M15]|nr:hypothetical protein [Christensenellaceae bacterium OttesenSCG-928-M15]